jgi:hypothetical protein
VPAVEAPGTVRVTGIEGAGLRVEADTLRVWVERSMLRVGDVDDGLPPPPPLQVQNTAKLMPRHAIFQVDIATPWKVRGWFEV